MTNKNYIGIDLGASNGRIVIGRLDQNSLSLKEIHRFPNEPVFVNGHLYWDVLFFLKEIKTGIRRAHNIDKRQISGIGIDSWALDFGLLDQHDHLISNPFCYRDDFSGDILPVIQEKLSEKTIYQRTGMTFSTISSLAQLLAIREKEPQQYQQAKTFLLLPNLLSFWLTGEKKSEVTIAGNSQMLNVTSLDWDYEIQDMFDLDKKLFPPITPTASYYGNISISIQNELDVPNIPVFATAGHDTASAVAAAPIEDEHAAIISCGTWSVIGSEMDEPILTDRAMKNGFHNMQAACGKIFFAIYSNGLWPVQQVKKEYDAQGPVLEYGDLISLAEEANPFTAIVNPDDAVFFTPGNMEKKIADFCRGSGQTIPQGKGEFIRIMLEGLALRYKKSIQSLEDTAGRKIERVHIIGGGSKNTLLCQFTADATQKTVIAGPAEAAVIANVLLQAIAQGEIANLFELRKTVRASYQLKIFYPSKQLDWSAAAQKFDQHTALSI